jgi:hypothetical protein
VLNTFIGLLGAIAVLVGLYLIAPPLALVAVGVALVRYATLREREAT